MALSSPLDRSLSATIAALDLEESNENDDDEETEAALSRDD